MLARADPRAGNRRDLYTDHLLYQMPTLAVRGLAVIRNELTFGKGIATGPVA
jgi:hypothetical protein